MISDVPTNVCRAQEEKLNDHFSKVSPVPEMNIKIEKIGINEILIDHKNKMQNN